MENDEYVSTLGGRVHCKRCQAKAKSTQLQCRLPAVGAKRVCRVHGGLSRGLVTKEGRERCRTAKAHPRTRNSTKTQRTPSKVSGVEATGALGPKRWYGG